MRLPKCLSLSICLMAGLTQASRAGNDPIQLYTEALKSLSRNCRLDYVSTVTAPDGSVMRLAGSLAIQGSIYLDSSNARFVLINERWIITADHEEKEVSALYIPAWKAKYGRHTDLVTSGFLLGDPDVLRKASVQVKEVGKDTVMLQLLYSDPTVPLQSLTLQYRKGSVIPVRYWGKVRLFPTLEEAGDAPTSAPEQAAMLEFSCFNIHSAVPAALFDESRVVGHRGGKATLKRYNGYRSFRNNG